MRRTERAGAASADPEDCVRVELIAKRSLGSLAERPLGRAAGVLRFRSPTVLVSRLYNDQN
jgi:hypothetical protein